MHRHRRSTALAGALLTAGLAPALAQDAADEIIDRAPERCIVLNRVDDSEVIDDRTLIFHMRDGGIYLNHLSRECPGLKREERFMYSPTNNRLCDIDTVTVLEQGGFGMTRGFTCMLGQFHPITELELAELKRIEEGGGPGERGEGEFEVVPVDPDELDDLDEADEARAAAEEDAGD